METVVPFEVGQLVTLNDDYWSSILENYHPIQITIEKERFGEHAFVERVVILRPEEYTYFLSNNTAYHHAWLRLA